ncbi:sensor histidine kinase [Paraconexibacter algicola]|uniref:histidine kinase n=1 Tax=Paraconexibacter algicola TaxID=2133960 RepID=A0A2T4UF71_9ACTN|nr:ATP-binding protein [Paraconexibacter algicola]PTL56426.1 ATPase [Paraconexibacter algicola]
MRSAALLDHPARVVALVRLAAVPVFFFGERLIDHPEAHSGAFRFVLAFGVVYAAVLAGLAFSPGRRPLPLRVTATIDLALLGGLTYTSGGPFSQLRYGFFVVPVAAALLRGPRETAIASAAALTCYLVATIAYPDSRQDAVAFEATQSLYFVWLVMASTLLSAVLARRQRQIVSLSDERGRLVARAIEAEERERRRLAEALHDDAIQNLLAARQALGSGDDDRPADLGLVRTGLDRTVSQLRDAIFDLHPHLLRHAGLAAALQAVADRFAERLPDRSVAWEITVADDATGPTDEVVFAIARELMTNAVRHADARSVAVEVRRRQGGIALTVSDDGRGIDRRRARDAPLHGHIGLASCAERAEALGGRLQLASAPGEGARVEVWLPADPQA